MLQAGGTLLGWLKLRQQWRGFLGYSVEGVLWWSSWSLGRDVSWESQGAVYGWYTDGMAGVQASANCGVPVCSMQGAPGRGDWSQDRHGSVSLSTLHRGDPDGTTGVEASVG